RVWNRHVLPHVSGRGGPFRGPPRGTEGLLQRRPWAEGPARRERSAAVNRGPITPPGRRPRQGLVVASSDSAWATLRSTSAACCRSSLLLISRSARRASDGVIACFASSTQMRHMIGL